MDEQIQAHYVSPMSTEDEMSIEDMLAEIPEGDLQSVAIVQGHIYMPLPFARKYILPTLRVHKSTIHRQRRKPPRRNRNSNAVLNF